MLNIKTKTDNFNIDINLRSKYTILVGDTATGKSLLFKEMRNTTDRDDIACINYESTIPKVNYDAMINLIKQSKQKIFIIDQVDDIQRENDEIIRVISRDTKNTFILIGRGINLCYDISDIAEVSVVKDKITIDYIAPEPIV